MSADALIVNSVLHGNADRFAELVDRYLPMVRGVCAARFSDPATVDDLTQETFVTGFRKLSALRHPEKFAPWLAAIARHLCKTYQRTLSRRKAAEERLALEPLKVAVPADEVVTRQDLYAWVHRQIGTLPDKTREAVLLHYVEGLSVREIARQCGVRDGAVKKRLEYGRKLLGHKLLEDMGVLPAAFDNERMRQRIVRALPLTLTPWLVSGEAAAIVGNGILSAKGIGIVLAVAVFAIMLGSRWMRDTAQTNPPASTGTAATLVAEPEPNTGDLNDAALNENETGTLRVRLVYKEKRLLSQYKTAFRGNGWDEVVTTDAIPKDGREPAPHAWVRICKVALDATHDRGADEQEPAVRFVRLVTKQVGKDRRTGNATRAAGTQPDLSFQREVQANEAGDVVLEDLPAGTFLVEALSATAYDRQLAYPYHAGIADPFDQRGWGYNALYTDVSSEEAKQVTIGVEDAGPIHVTVVDAKTGSPVEGVEVSVVGIATYWRTATEITKEDGTAIFHAAENDLGHGPIEIQISGANSSGYGVEVWKGERRLGQPIDATLVLQRFGGAITGTVYTADGERATGMQLFRLNTSKAAVSKDHWRTDENGKYRIEHDGGLVRIYAQAGLFCKSEPAELSLERDQDAEQDITLPPSVPIFLHVEGSDGSVVEELTQLYAMYDWNNPSKHGYTNLGSPKLVDGVFELPYGPLKPISFVAVSVGYSATESNLTDPQPGQPVHVTIKLEPLGDYSLDVLVENEEGQAIVGSVVDLTERVRSHSTTFDGATQRAEADEDGVAHFGRLNATEYAVNASAETEDSRLTGKTRVVLPNESRATVVLQTRPKHPVELGDAGVSSQANQKFMVKPYLPDAPNRQLDMDMSYGTVLGPDGADLALWQLAQPGMNLIAIAKPGYTAGFAWVEVKESPVPGVIEVPVELGESGLVYGRATYANNAQAVTGRTLSVYPLIVDGRQVPIPTDERSMARIGHLMAQGVTTDENGAFTIEYLPAGRYAVFVLNAEPVEVDIIPGQETGPVELVVNDPW